MSNPPPGDESKKRKRRSGWDVDNVEEGKKSSPWPPLPPTAPPQLSVPVPPPPSSSYPISTLTTSPLPGISSLLTPQLPKPNSRIYVGSINYDLREADLIALFSVFGPVVSCDMTLDNSTGKHKGFCFIQYSEPAHAEAAMTMDGFQVGGRKRACRSKLEDLSMAMGRLLLLVATQWASISVLFQVPMLLHLSWV